MKKITKVLSCLVVIAILMSVMAWTVVAQNASNREEDLRDNYVLSSDTAVSSSDVPIYEFLTYANFGSDNSVYVPGQGVGGYEDKLYVPVGAVCYVYNVSIPEGEDPNMHPNNSESPGPMAPRTLSLIETYNFAADCGWSGGHHAEFYVDENYIYYGPDRYGVGGIEKWAKNPDGTFGAYLGRVKDKNGDPIPVPPINGETFGYDPNTNTWYTCTRGRAVYSFDMDTDTSWQYEFTYPTYEGDHHDGLEFVNGFLWLSDMTTNWIGQWKKNPDGTWEEKARFYYDNPIEDDVEGMGYGPFGHLWVSGWSRLYEIGGEELGVVLEGIELSIRLDKTEYNPNEVMKIYVDITDAGGNSNYPITEDNTEVRINGTIVDILDIGYELIYQPSSDPTELTVKEELVIKVGAPDEAGDYTVLVQVETNLGTASDSKGFSVFEAFKFVQMTDVHIGIVSKDLTLPQTKIKRLDEAIYEMNERVKPDFILITGDNVEWGGGLLGQIWYQHFLNNLNRLSPEIKVYILPGNHDHYGRFFGTEGDLSNYNGYINQYMDEVRPVIRADLNPPIPPNNYSFDYGVFLFVGLDSGRDEGWVTLGGSGLTPEQLESLGNLDLVKQKVIFIHHPAIDENWKKCIRHNREEFINYCVGNNVQIVLTGHIHADKIFNASGGRVSANSKERPLFIQTPSLTKDDNVPHGYRIFDATSSGIVVYPYDQTGSYPNIKAEAGCPITLHVYDSQGRHTGINLTTSESEFIIPHSFYLRGFAVNYTEANETINETMPETILLYDVSQDYSFKVIANLSEEQKVSPEIETFNFTVERQTTNGSRTIIFYSNISLFENTTATLPFNMTTADYTMEIDYDGDGITNETRFPDFVYVDYMPKAEIISPINNSTYLFGEEITFQGSGSDLEDGVLTNASLVWFSDLDSVIGIGNEFSEANLSVGSHNITLRVNDSLDQINTSTVSIRIRSTQPDMVIDILKDDEIPGIEPHTELIETLADKTCNLTVYIKNTGYGTLNNTQILTNVTITKDVGNINEGEEKFVSIQFTPTTPGLFALNVTVTSDEIEKNVTRGLLVEKFGLKVSIPKTEYNQSEPVPVNISVTNEVPNIRFIDLKIEINISNPIYNQTSDVPLLSLAPSKTKNVTFSWDTTGVNNGTYTINTSLKMADQEMVSDEKHVCIGKILLTDLPNVELIFADPTVTSINVTSLNLSEINETYKPEGITSQYAYMINATGAGNFTLTFTNISDADMIAVYKIDPTSVPLNQWIELDATTTADTVTFTMEVGDPPVVFGSGAPPVAARVPTLTPIGIIALAGLLAIVAVSRIRKKK